MKRLGVLGLCLLATFAISATATAMEELPEVGRCLKVPGAATHRYASASCTTRSEGEDSGRFEWSPGPGPEAGFSSTSEVSELETVGHINLRCRAGTARGEFTSARTEVATIAFSGCEYGSPHGTPCSSPGLREGEVVTDRLEGSLGYISGAGSVKPTIGIRLVPATGTRFAAIECSGVKVTLGGSIVATLAVATNRMTPNSTVRFRASRGHQIPEALEGGQASVLTASSGGEAEQAGLTSTESNTTEEPLEIRVSG